MLAFLIALLAPPRCLACDAPVEAGGQLCGGCRRALPWLPAAGEACGGLLAWAPVAFDGPARALVHALKFGGRTAAAGVMAAQIAANAPPGLLAAGTLVPVPAHPVRARRRGFDQARLLARRLGVRTGLPVRDVLVRRGRAGTQVGAGRATRVNRDLGIAACGRVDGRAILVDDVRTTGATLAACARAVREAGASEIAAVTYAQVLG